VNVVNVCRGGKGRSFSIPGRETLQGGGPPPRGSALRRAESGVPFVDLLGVTWAVTVAASAFAADSGVRMLCYSVQPNAYLNDHAREIAGIYDGFFFPVGTWENADRRFVGEGQSPPEWKDWLDKTRVNLASLRAAGVTENFLTVCFTDNGEWPSPQTLLSRSYTDRMSAQFAAIGRTAKDLGFRGVCIDVEYPYPRYAVGHEIYKYENYTVADLTRAAHRQGRRCMAAILDAFPGAVIIVLPGEVRARPIVRSYQLGLLGEMAGRDAPGGFHLGSEFTYCMNDPVTTIATACFDEPAIERLADGKTADYWRRRCTIAPGVWPLHMVETGGKDYPIQPWAKEIAELREQMGVLRAVARRYIWSFTGNPSWYVYSPELEARYGLKRPDLKREDIDLRDWHRLLRCGKGDRSNLPERPEGCRAQIGPVPCSAPALMRLVEEVRMYERREITPEDLCDVFGTPGRWQVLGIVGNPHKAPQFAATEAVDGPVNARAVFHGRDGAVRWFTFDNLDPRGITSCTYVFDYRNTDNGAAHFVTNVDCPGTRSGVLHVGWDDGIIIRLGGEVVFNRADYPARGKGMQYRDRYIFEEHVPITLKQGRQRLAVTSINSHGNWVFAIRLTDAAGVPFPDVRFRLE
jgi:hypothetical protein